MRLTNEETKIKLSDTKRYDLQDHKMFTKLSQYEDIEEELGIDFITLIKALKNGIIYKTDYGWDKEDYHWNYIDAKYISLGMSNYEPFLIIKLEQEPNIEHLELSNFGKTWALAEEELK